MRRPRRLVLSAAAAGLALAATGCSAMSPVQTHEFYQAADGTNGTVEVDGQMLAGIRNAVLVISEDGSATFSGTAVNYSDEEVSVELTAEHEGTAVFATAVSVPADEVVALGPGEGQQLVEANAAEILPGSMLQLEVAAGGQSTTITLPTVDSSADYYGGASDGGA